MELIQYNVDAFTHEVFGGNPAAVCPLKEWLPDDIMQKIATENNLSETAFFVPEKNAVHIRWFTPTAEIDLAGHPTLAASHVLYEYLDYNQPEILFHSKSGELRVKKIGKHEYQLNFPARPPKTCRVAKYKVEAAIGVNPKEVHQARDLLVVLENERQLAQLQPDMEKLKQLHKHGVSITAPGDQCDFVSRFFAPAMGIPEDPVTGSAHCTLVPYWAEKLNKKKKLKAIQISQRKGYLSCDYLNDRVLIAGKAVTFMNGIIYI
ncbi:MAG: PhzF family phenazine biosynthesis isomerase [Bacteroidetes bacterium]|jgi:PhzF family phenazine biosynthesis protein|nr:PhzF family phenazine biosynthesis isomerase [Bacteroidota bacterium]